MWSLIVLIFISIHVCASESICETLRQFHGNKPPMSIDSPFTIVTSAPAVNQSEILIIKIKSIQKELRFGKFIINARSTSPPYTTVSINCLSHGKLLYCLIKSSEDLLHQLMDCD